MWPLTLSGIGLFEVQKRRGEMVFLQPRLTFRSTAAVKINCSQYNHQLWQKFKKKSKWYFVKFPAVMTSHITTCARNLGFSINFVSLWLLEILLLTL